MRVGAKPGPNVSPRCNPRPNDLERPAEKGGRKVRHCRLPGPGRVDQGQSLEFSSIKAKIGFLLLFPEFPGPSRTRSCQLARYGTWPSCLVAHPGGKTTEYPRTTTTIFPNETVVLCGIFIVQILLQPNSDLALGALRSRGTLSARGSGACPASRILHKRPA